MRQLCLAALLLTSVAYADDPPKIDPAKQALVALPIGDWQTVLASVEDNDHLSAREANRISRTIITQVQQQLQRSTPEKK